MVGLEASFDTNTSSDCLTTLENGNITVEKESSLVCLDGNPVVNGITLKRYDYDDLTIDKIYNINLNDGVLALFTRQ